MALRYLAAKEGIWDAVTNKPGSFTPEMLDKLYKIKDLNTPMVTYDQYGVTRSIPNPESLNPNDLKNVAPPKKPGMILERLRKRYRDSELIDLINWLAKNEDTTPMDQAQNGTEMKFYQEGLDFKPKTISKNGSAIKDDMGQWAHPGEITQIGSNEITMKGVEYPVLGISDTGDRKMMYPGKDYKFDGNMVTEYPLAQDGENITKKLKKEAEEKLERMKKPKATVSQYTPKKGEAERLDREKLQRIADENKPLNKFARSKASGNLQDAIEAALIMEGGLAAGKLVGKGAKAAGKYLTEETALKNAYKLNPLAFKPKTDAYYRMIGEGGYADALESGVVRPPKELGQEYAYYNKGYPLDTRFRNATGRAGYEGPYMAEVKGNKDLFVNDNPQGFTGPMFDDPIYYSKQNIPIGNSDVKLYKENWLKRYKEVSKKEDGGWLNKYK
jgi:hypothetical protein